MQMYENLGQFYLGRVVDSTDKTTTDEYYLYDSKDLTTHAVCVGMTGSGKTGLCINLLEEAAMDNIPALVIDPKGDMTNLLLSFPELTADNFQPWLLQSEADQEGLDMNQYAQKKAQDWKDGLASWDISPDRIRTMRESSDISIYTPGSSGGRPLSMVQMMDSPSAEVLNDREALADYTESTVSSLLSLLSIDSDPLSSEEHILLSNILINEWNAGKSVTFPSLIQSILKPNLTTVGVLPLDSFYTEKERQGLAMKLNNLLASPQFSLWMEGEPLNIDKLLYTNDGKPRISIISINHLNDNERMFVVSSLLNQVVSWTRKQTGTTALRAILYMDEIFGYFPPTANPPSKKPLLTLLKQARAYGVGVMLTTQNPVDLDYKGLSNIGTWFIGRLQTEQDKNRLLDGLRSASGVSDFQSEISDLLSSLPKRTFLVNNVHKQGTLIFQTRWAMSYLAGPLTKSQISLLEKDNTSPAVPTQAQAHVPPTNEGSAFSGQAPVVGVAASTNETAQAEVTEEAPGDEGISVAPKIANGVDQFYVPAVESSNRLRYLPSLLAAYDIHYEDTKAKINEMKQVVQNTYIKNEVIPVDWTKNTGFEIDLNNLKSEPQSGASYEELPAGMNLKTTFNNWQRDLVDTVYRNDRLMIFQHKITKEYSRPGETEQEFMLRTESLIKEERDRAMDDLRLKYQKKIETMEERVRKAELTVDKEKEQAKAAKTNTFVSIGSTVLDSILGRKLFGKSTASKAGSSARSASRARQQEQDVARAEENVRKYQEDVEALEKELETELQELSDKYNQTGDHLDHVEISPKKKDIQVKAFSLVWLPFEEAADGLRPLFETQEATAHS